MAMIYRKVFPQGQLERHTTTRRQDACATWEQRLSTGYRRIYFYGLGGELLMEYPAERDGQTAACPAERDRAASRAATVELPDAYAQEVAWSTLYCTRKQTLYFAGQRINQWTDRRGDVRYTATASQGSDISRNFYPYGEEVTATQPNDIYKFADTYRDADTAVDYAVGRYLAGVTGRFLSIDPASQSARLSEPNTMNRYAYAESDPVTKNDPNGMYT